jgi:hypothetical protein
LKTSAGPLLAQTSSSLDSFNDAPLRPRGQNVIPIFDGWYPNADGDYTLCFGYFNMNTEESLDVPGVPPDGEPLPMLQVDASAVQEVGAF